MWTREACWWRCWWLAAAIWCLVSAAAAQEPARVILPADQVVPVTEIDVETVAADAPFAVQPSARQSLPDAWSRTRPGFHGTVSYRLLLHREDRGLNGSFAVSIPRASMGVRLWFNGVPLVRDGAVPEAGPPARLWNSPLLYVLPETLWEPGDNLLWLQISAERDQGGGLSAFRIGPQERLRAAHAWRLWWQNQLVSVLNVFVVSLGAFFLVLWWRHPTKRHYGYFGAAAVMMALSNVNMVVTTTPLPQEVWELAVHLLLLWGALLLALFPIGFARLHQPEVERAALVFGSVVTLLVVLERQGLWLSWWAAGMVPVLVMDGVAIVWLLRYVRREQPLGDNLLVCAAAFGALGLGTHDVLVRLGVLPFDQPYTSPYMTPVLMSALCWLVAGDYARSQQRLADSHRELAERLAQREQELQRSFAHLAEIERARAAAAERSRILRDMHDGVGAHITTAMRQIEGGRVEPALVAQTLRDSLDQLKLSIDAMNLPLGDVNALLASLRYRLQRRIESAGLVLHWAVEPLPPWPAGQVDAAAMHHLQFIVFECLSNALQHAQATALTVSAAMDLGDEGLCITLADNGCGLSCDPSAALHTVRERAALIGAALRVESNAPGTRVVLTLPLSPRAPPSGTPPPHRPAPAPAPPDSRQRPSPG